jgi:hypothetical protein
MEGYIWITHICIKLICVMYVFVSLLCLLKDINLLVSGLLPSVITYWFHCIANWFSLIWHWQAPNFLTTGLWYLKVQKINNKVRVKKEFASLIHVRKRNCKTSYHLICVESRIFGRGTLYFTSYSCAIPKNTIQHQILYIKYFTGNLKLLTLNSSC